MDTGMIKAMNHVGVSVADIERAIGFYRDVLGMDLIAAPFAFGGPMFEQVMALDGARGRMCVLARNGLQLELFEFAHPRPAPMDPDQPVSDRGLSHFGVEVADIEAAYARLAAAGVRFHCPVQTFPGGVKATYARDPDGNVFELLELPRAAG